MRFSNEQQEIVAQSSQNFRKLMKNHPSCRNHHKTQKNVTVGVFNFHFHVMKISLIFQLRNFRNIQNYCMEITRALITKKCDRDI